MFKSLVKLPIFLLFFRSGRRVLGTALVALALFVLFRRLCPEAPELSPYQQRTLDALVDDAVSRFPWSDETGLVRLVAEEDAWAPHVTAAIRDRVANFGRDGSRKFDISRETVMARMLSDFIGDDRTGRLTAAQLERIRARMNEDTLLVVRFGSRDYAEDEREVSGHLTCTFMPKSSGKATVVESSERFEKAHGGASAATPPSRRMPAQRRVVRGLGFVLLFPFVVAPLTLGVVRLRSAGANAILMAAYAAINFAVVFAVVGRPVGWGRAAALCVALPVVLWYVLAVCEMVAKPLFRERMGSVGAVR